MTDLEEDLEELEDAMNQLAGDVQALAQAAQATRADAAAIDVFVQGSDYSDALAGSQPAAGQLAQLMSAWKSARRVERLARHRVNADARRVAAAQQDLNSDILEYAR